jgi:hypothetical protein
MLVFLKVSLPSVILGERMTNKMVGLHLNALEVMVDVCIDP